MWKIEVDCTFFSNDFGIVKIPRKIVRFEREHFQKPVFPISIFVFLNLLGEK